MPKWVMVLNDGTTYTDLDGCAIVAVPNFVNDDDIEEYVAKADGWYCFNRQPTELEGNNNFSLDDLKAEEEEEERKREEYEEYRDNWYRRNL